MWIEPYRASLLLALACVLTLGFAFALQYLGDYAPCHLCVLERWPYVAGIVLAVAGYVSGWPRAGLASAGLAVSVSAAISGFHVGVEQGVFTLPESCQSLGNATTIEALREQLLNAKPTCDQVRLVFFGLSLAAWNGLWALVLGLGAITLATHRRQ